MLTDRIAEGVRGTGVSMPDAPPRAPHILSLGFKDGMPAGLVEGLATEGVYVAARLGRMRVSPHVYNDEADADRFVAALAGGCGADCRNEALRMRLGPACC